MIIYIRAVEITQLAYIINFLTKLKLNQNQTPIKSIRCNLIRKKLHSKRIIIPPNIRSNTQTHKQAIENTKVLDLQ